MLSPIITDVVPCSVCGAKAGEACSLGFMIHPERNRAYRDLALVERHEVVRLFEPAPEQLPGQTGLEL
jgi:hypothetical protein